MIKVDIKIPTFESEYKKSNVTNILGGSIKITDIRIRQKAAPRQVFHVIDVLTLVLAVASHLALSWYTGVPPRASPSSTTPRETREAAEPGRTPGPGPVVRVDPGLHPPHHVHVAAEGLVRRHEPGDEHNAHAVDVAPLSRL
jgi:hypothetical protein